MLFSLDRICAYCGHRHFKKKNPDGPGLTHCKHYDEWFSGFMDFNRTPIGERTCDHWKHMAEDKENEDK